jgi:hypothetical protein
MTYFRATDTEVLAPGNVPRFATPLGYQGTAIDIIRAVIHGSLSGVMASSLDLTPYSKDPLYRRIVQLGMLMPVVQATRPIPTELVAARHQLGPYLETYLQEARDRGIPVIRPLAMQYSSDPEAARYTDAFMLGDEILAAPMYTTGETRSVYLPMGTWTDLDTNQAWPGRQVIPVSAKHNRVPLFAKNGTILPLAAGGSESPIGEGPGKSAALILHYFPKLAAEFFLFESHSGETTQFHAAPAGIYLRLEVESKEDRIYDWVVHHIPEPSEIAGDGLSFRRVQARLEEPATWFYDSPARNLYVRMRGPAGGDNIVNISFPETRGITRQ